MHKIIIFLCLFIGSTTFAQEMQFKIKVNAQKISNLDPKVFQTLENTLNDFLNSQVWTDDQYEVNEKIQCNLQLTISEQTGPTSFSGDITIFATRPVYGSDYSTIIFSHKDNDIAFNYEQYQPLEYSENAFTDNLSNVLSYYVYLILALDGDSFSSLGGDKYFKKVQDIVNVFPQNLGDKYPGWTAKKGTRNRYWIVDNYLRPAARDFRVAFYNYHRLGLDIMSSNPDRGREVINKSISVLPEVARDIPNSIILKIFTNSKSNELMQIYKGGTKAEKDNLYAVMVKVDPSNANKYRRL